jgi:hypothetical protein
MLTVKLTADHLLVMQSKSQRVSDHLNIGITDLNLVWVTDVCSRFSVHVEASQWTDQPSKESLKIHHYIINSESEGSICEY